MGQAQSNWHKEVVGITLRQGTNPSTGPNDELPLAELQEKTNSYLRRKKQKLSATERDVHLTVLVRAHPEKHIAIAACAHVLSRQAIRDLLRREIQLHLKDDDDIIRYMQTILTVTRANPDAISDLEEECASALLHLSSPHVLSIGRHLRTLTAGLASGVQKDVVFCPFVSSVPPKACKLLASELEVMKLECEWSRAHGATGWMTGIPGTSPITENFLNLSFQGWRVWAYWRPNLSRLALWKRLDSENRRQLRFVLALEGPDFISQRKPNLREALVPLNHPQHGHQVCHETFRVKLNTGTPAEALGMLEQLLAILDEICSICPSSLPLFIYVSTHKLVDAELMEILHQVNISRNSSVSTGVLSLLSASVNTFHLNSVKKLLPALESSQCQGLRDILSSKIVAVVEEAMTRLQSKFCAQLEEGRGADGVARTLHSLGKSLAVSSWLLPLLGDTLQSTLSRWPTTEDIDVLLKLRTDAQGVGTEITSTLVGIIDEYSTANLAGRGVVDEAVANQIDGLIFLWQQTTDSDIRAAALAVAERSIIPIEIRRHCLGQLCTMPPKFVNQVVMVVKNDTDMACINFVDNLMSKRITDNVRICWRELLQWVVDRRRDTLLDFALMHFQVKSWFEFLERMRNLFGSRLHSSESKHPMFRRALYSWADRLSEQYLAVLTSLETTVGGRASMKWILTGWEEADTILPLLTMLKSPGDRCFQPMIRPLLTKVRQDGSNAETVFKTMVLLGRATQGGVDVCIRLLDLYEQDATQTSEGLLVGWLRAAENPIDTRVLEALAAILGLQIPTSVSSPVSIQNLQAASDFLDGQYNAIILEALRIESMRLALKNHDAQQTSSLLSRLGIEDPSALEDAIAYVPDTLIDVIEKIAPGEFEMSFPLTRLKPLQRVALGMGNARSLIVRLYLGGGDNSAGFCIHLNPEEAFSVPAADNQTTCARHGGHYSWEVEVGSSAPDMQFCTGRSNRILYQISRDLWKHLANGFTSLGETYNFVIAALETLSSRCIVCGDSLGVQLLRSTTCKKACSIWLRKSSLEVRLADLRQDPLVVDLLLAMVHAVSSSSSASRDTELLPGNPLRNGPTLRAINNFPTTSSLQGGPDLAASISSLGRNSERLLSWMCTSYRGFLASATGALKVPSMPGVYQFVLASASPEKEMAFDAHLHSSSSEVVFHGTSLDRMYAILRNGLRIMSAGPLQKHGAVHGSGIYVADEPQTAWSYATPPARGADSGWPASDLRNTRVLLGCEMVRSGRAATQGVRIVADESQIMVRYIFMCPDGMMLPIAAHIVPAMKSVFNSLRIGSA